MIGEKVGLTSVSLDKEFMSDGRGTAECSEVIVTAWSTVDMLSITVGLNTCNPDGILTVACNKLFCNPELSISAVLTWKTSQAFFKLWLETAAQLDAELLAIWRLECNPWLWWVDGMDEESEYKCDEELAMVIGIG